VAAAAAAVARRGLAAAPGAKWLEGPALAAWQLASVDAHVVQPRWVAATCATHSPACISHDSVRFHGRCRCAAVRGRGQSIRAAASYCVVLEVNERKGGYASLCAVITAARSFSLGLFPGPASHIFIAALLKSSSGLRSWAASSRGYSWGSQPHLRRLAACARCRAILMPGDSLRDCAGPCALLRGVALTPMSTPGMGQSGWEGGGWQ
jgi:hypothetical protein